MRLRRVLNPAVCGVRLSSLLTLYWWRLRHRGVQELLAGCGIAVGVALLLGVLIANTSSTASDGQLVHGVVGSARFQLAARSSAGFQQKLAERVQSLAGVAVAAPVLRESATIVGPKGAQATIELIGVGASIVALGGSSTENLGAGVALLSGGIGLPSSVADAVGARAGREVTLWIGGEDRSIRVRAVLGDQTIGAASASPIAVGLLHVVQELAGLPGRVTDVFVKTRPGAEHEVAEELHRLAAGRLDVVAADHELSILTATAKPAEQSTMLFAAVSAMVGFLLALNAMLLTMPERRRFVAELRMQGFGSRQVLLVVGFQALVLGCVASIVGIALGDVVSHVLFNQVPTYLTFAFPIGSQQVISATVVLLAIACGVLSALLASSPLLYDLRAGRPIDAVLHESGEPGQRIDRRAISTYGIAGAASIVLVRVLVLVEPGLAVLAGGALALAVLLLLPATLALLLRVIGPISERVRGSMFALAVVELRATATRAIVLAGIAALAVYGSVAIEGARGDLITGLDSAVTEYLDSADVWVTTSNNFLTIDSFHADNMLAAIAKQPQIASVRAYQGGLIDIGTRRLWIRARPATDARMIQASQLLDGNLAQATRRLRGQGWVAISNGLAKEQRVHVGGVLSLPTPSGIAHLRVAAITTNAGWVPGAITMNTRDYSHYWHSTEPTAFEVNVKQGVTPIAGKRAVERALGDRPGFFVQTFQERAAIFKATARQGLSSLSEISTLLLVAAALAVALALSAAIWQRRARLASLKAQGFDSKQLWRALLLESALVLSVGCLEGAIVGVYGHVLASRWLESTAGYPAPFSLGVPSVLVMLAGVMGIALVVFSIPGWVAARVPARLSFQE
jgi:putative ABC transport system permease protein